MHVTYVIRIKYVIRIINIMRINGVVRIIDIMRIKGVVRIIDVMRIKDVVRIIDFILTFPPSPPYFPLLNLSLLFYFTDSTYSLM